MPSNIECAICYQQIPIGEQKSLRNTSEACLIDRQHPLGDKMPEIAWANSLKLFHHNQGQER